MAIYPISVARHAFRHESIAADVPNPKLSVKESARYLGLSQSTLNKMRLNGNGPGFLKLGRRVLYDMRDLELW